MSIIATSTTGTYVSAMLIAKPPNEFSEKDLTAFVDLVVSEGEVSPYRLLERVKRARGLVMIYDGEILVGTAAVKNPEPGYRADVFAKSKSRADDTTYPIELGYVVVAESHRGQGLSWSLVDAAMPFANGSAQYATTRGSNVAMQRVLPARGFAADGFPYPSVEHPGEDIHLFLRASDLPGATSE
ncbi:GNAT family N-acetyltransferase [Mesorhizobium sp. BR1-1-9]|uniref:GNAT family N-acetyltransferase n=1 Tax=Mesorhizobium sp. BR1-1-9 TaxID=2876646 RepID=UPI001CD18F58|nr:GNAT family N-acetyltransferase [Mesorhizobium sp. BR1-1-9]MBZ9871600.1 GNAT family N-acetyltransferase [Mesorhizobium sp. BR1-1-9]